MGRFIDYYALLSISNDASLEEVAAAYEVCAATLLAQDLSPEQYSKQQMLLERAHAVLGDEFKRMTYDMNGEGGIVEEIEEEEADIQNIDQNGKTPLWLALIRRYFELSQSLYDSFAEGNVTFGTAYIFMMAIFFFLSVRSWKWRPDPWEKTRDTICFAMLILMMASIKLQLFDPKEDIDPLFAKSPFFAERSSTSGVIAFGVFLFLFHVLLFIWLLITIFPRSTIV